MASSYTVVSPSAHMVKMTIMDFPDIPKRFRIKASKKSLHNLRRQMAEEILKGSGIFQNIL